MIQPKSEGSKTILVTGCAGFIGSWVALYLLENYPDVRVVGFDLETYCASPKTVHLLKEHGQFQLVHGDVGNSEDINKLFAHHKIDEIVHLAAESHVDRSFKDPQLFVHSNITGTLALLNAVAAQSHSIRLVHVSTDEVYGDSCATTAVTEDSVLMPTNPYAASKAAAEMFVHAYTRSYGIHAAIVRMNNVYGPRQYPEKIIPTFVTRIANGQKCYIQGDGHHSRRFLFAHDAARAIDTVRVRGKDGETYNAGVENELTNVEVAEYLLRLCGHDPSEASVRQKYIGFTTDRPFNDIRYPLVSEKLTSLGWSPETSLEEGMRQTVDFYKTEPAWFP